MAKIKRVDFKAAQSVCAFACPCLGSCASQCGCSGDWANHTSTSASQMVYGLPGTQTVNYN